MKKVLQAVILCAVMAVLVIGQRTLFPLAEAAPSAQDDEVVEFDIFWNAGDLSGNWGNVLFWTGNIKHVITEADYADLETFKQYFTETQWERDIYPKLYIGKTVEEVCRDKYGMVPGDILIAGTNADYSGLQSKMVYPKEIHFYSEDVPCNLPTDKIIYGDADNFAAYLDSLDIREDYTYYVQFLDEFYGEYDYPVLTRIPARSNGEKWIVLSIGEHFITIAPYEEKAEAASAAGLQVFALERVDGSLDLNVKDKDGKTVQSIVYSQDAVVADLAWNTLASDRIEEMVASGKAMVINYDLNGVKVKLDIPANEFKVQPGVKFYGPQNLLVNNLDNATLNGQGLSQEAKDTIKSLAGNDSLKIGTDNNGAVCVGNGANSAFTLDNKGILEAKTGDLTIMY